jgi:diacylglycerol kinase family enzyme
VVVANCQYYGGGMRISPKSVADDGVLDVLAMAGPRRVACTTLPTVTFEIVPGALRLKI